MASGPPDVMANQEPAEVQEECSGETFIKCLFSCVVMYLECLLSLTPHETTPVYMVLPYFLFARVCVIAYMDLFVMHRLGKKC